jgi:hypothetical protein
MNTSKTRHLDAAIEIFSGGKAKRASRKAGVEITVMAASNGYVIQANNKIVETGAGDAEYAKQRAEARAEAIRKLGKTVVVTIY